MDQNSTFNRGGECALLPNFIEGERVFALKETKNKYVPI